jgi:hypothetical protein
MLVRKAARGDHRAAITKERVLALTGSSSLDPPGVLLMPPIRDLDDPVEARRLERRQDRLQEHAKSIYLELTPATDAVAAAEKKSE